MKIKLIVAITLLFTVSPIFAMDSEVNDPPKGPRSQIVSLKKEKNEIFQVIEQPLVSMQNNTESLEGRGASLMVSVGWEKKPGTRKFSLGKNDQETLEAIRAQIIDSVQEKAKELLDVSPPLSPNADCQRGRKVSRTIPLERRRKSSGSSKRSTKSVSPPLTSANLTTRENVISLRREAPHSPVEEHKNLQIGFPMMPVGWENKQDTRQFSFSKNGQEAQKAKRAQIVDAIQEKTKKLLESPEDSSKEELLERDRSPIRQRKELIITEEEFLGRPGSLPPQRERQQHIGLSLNK